MTSSRPGRPLASLAIVAASVAGGLLAHEPLLATLCGLVGGILTAVVGWPAGLFDERRVEPSSTAPTLEDHARELLAPITDPILLLRGGRILAANGAARQLLGQWIEGQDVRLALRHPATLERLGRSDQGEAVDQVEVTGIGQAERKWLLTTAALSNGARLVHLSDRSEAAAAERMRVDFVANASHELRTPLAIVLGFIETLADDSAGSDPALRARFLDLMHTEAKRMQQLIEDLMSLSRIEADRFNPPRDPVDLRPLVDEVGSACGPLLAERGNRLAVEDRSSGTVVQGDRGQLLQLIRNLVVNAVKYGRSDSDVSVRFEDAAAGLVRMTVTDRGEGIAPEHLPRLTERFYRVDAGRSRAVGGTGLGLAIVKHIVTRHRGRLDIRSRPGEGTSVEIALPKAQAAPPAASHDAVT
jgi:two-component system phosphate regulon sensor histidine kinase PhoR